MLILLKLLELRYLNYLILSKVTVKYLIISANSCIDCKKRNDAFEINDEVLNILA